MPHKKTSFAMLFTSSVVMEAIYSPSESSQAHFQLLCLTGGGVKVPLRVAFSGE
jgi:hypothetical protein